MNRVRLFVDFDGTLIDSRLRMYKLFKSLAPQVPLNFSEYWVLKRARRSHADILTKYLSYSSDQIAAFEELWMPNIEQHKWLDLDTPLEGVTEFLECFSRQVDLILVTARQHSSMVDYQLDKFGWLPLFTEVLVTGGVGSKLDLLGQRSDILEADWIIGDTPEDIYTGKRLGINTAAVLTGFVGADILNNSQPDLLLGHITDLSIDAISGGPNPV